MRIVSADVHLIDLETRFPFKYGIATMTRAPYAMVRVQVESGGRTVAGISADLLPPMTVRLVPIKVYGTSGWDDQAYLMPGVDLTFNQLQYRNFSVVVLNLHRPSALLGFHIGGIVGHKFLRDYRVTLDLKRSVMKLTKL